MLHEPEEDAPLPGARERAPTAVAEGAAASARAEAPPPIEVRVARTGGCLRLLAAAFVAPWLVGYGVTGAWAVARGARAVAGGLAYIDVGYSRAVAPPGVILVGALMLAAFAVLLAAAMLVVYDARGRGRWAAVFAVAAFLTAGSVWAAVTGGLHPGLWFLFFGGLLYAAVLSLIGLLRVTRDAGRVRIARP